MAVITAEMILQRTRQIVGADHALAFFDDRVAAHRHLLGARSSDAMHPAAVVMPDSAEQVQAVVKLAATHGFGITVIPNAAGNGAGTVPTGKASIVLDLSRMDTIIEFNADSGYALVEPGVNFDQLRAHLVAAGSAYWVDCDENGANSVSGSITERAFGYTPYGDHLLMQCGMEVVTANGEVVRTGMGALPGSDTWQLFKYNYGPYLDGLFSRSELAVVTKVGLWLMPAPPAYHPFMVTLPDAAALSQAVEVLRPLKIGMVVPNTVVISHLSADAELLRASGLVADATVDDLRKNAAFGEWHLFGALYGIADNVQLTWGMIADALDGIPGATVFSADDSPEHPVWPLRMRLMKGEPAYSKAGASVDRKLWFAAAAPMEGEAVTEMAQIVRGSLAQADVPYSHEFTLTWRTLFMRVSIPYTNEQLDGRRDAALALIDRLGAKGYSISHDSPELTAAVGARQTGDGLQKLCRSLGEALDPNGILTNDSVDRA
jgi:4-cresol dehydrogenase (hydroxylating)